MSVLECRRRGCDNIMCSRYSEVYGYICDECFEELKEYVLMHGPNYATFMDTQKQYSTPSFPPEEEFPLTR